jgi:O-antigen/teichoic acid export membrane protein
MTDITLSKYKIPIIISYANLALGLAVGIFATNLYGLEVVGWLYFNLGAQQLFGFLLTLGVGTYSIKHLARCKSKAGITRCLSLIILHIIAISLFLTVCLVVSFLAFSDEISQISIFFLALILVSSLRFLVEDLLLGLGYLKTSVFQAFVESFLRLSLLFIFPLEAKQDVLELLILSSLIPLIITGLVSLKKIINFRFSRIRYMYSLVYYREALVIFSSHFLAIFHTRSGIVIAGWFFSPSIVGVYGLLVNISEPILRLGTVISRFFMRAGANADKSSIKIIWKTILFVTFISVLALISLSMSFSAIDSTFYDSSLMQFYKEFNILLVYSLAFLLINLSSNVLNGMGMSRIVFKLFLMSSITYLILASISSFNGSFILFTASLSMTSSVLCLILLSCLYETIYGSSNINSWKRLR